ncbi:hypothetical protein F4859DRAFT_215671 [Xylaria cf. heliscus]|nr:hypothetical protein F4859DRAFT_215671 [Xylaria cf. heliscus]
MGGGAEHNANASDVSGDSTTVYTPTHTTEDDGSPRSPPSPVHENFSPRAPSPGKTYIIRHRNSGKVVALKRGRLGLEDDSDPKISCRWDCMQTLGWFGFCDTASNNFLGRDGNFAFRASAKLHLPWEWFVIAAQGNEGWYLQSPHWLSLRWVGIGKDGRTLVDVTSSAEAALWEFVEV